MFEVTDRSAALNAVLFPHKLENDDCKSNSPATDFTPVALGDTSLRQCRVFSLARTKIPGKITR